MPGDFVRLKPIATKERVAACGCVLFEQQGRTVTGEGVYVYGRERGMQPCGAGREHLPWMNEAVVGADDPDDFDEVIARFEEIAAVA